MTFEDLNIIPHILEALKKEGYTTPTPIQTQAIPVILSGKDLIGCAQTGTGKTAAFAIPILQILNAEKRVELAARSQRQANYQSSPPLRKDIKVLILTPTRELAIQIGEKFSAYGKHLNLRHAVIYGGVNQYSQVKVLRNGVDILIATPGRLLDLMNQKFINLSFVNLLTLDEADRMLDMGFIHDVKKIIAKVPTKRQTLFFSATMPEAIVKLSQDILRNPIRVSVTPDSSAAETVKQELYYVDKANKGSLLIHLLQKQKVTSALVFTRTKHGADKVAKFIQQSGIRAEAIHGNKSQNARQSALKSFKDKQTRVLVATDLASRGIDIDELSHVINFEIPNIPETYVHRIGRTGRAGLTGIALSFSDATEHPFIRDINKLIKGSIPIVEDHPFPMKQPLPQEPQRRGSGGGRSGRTGGGPEDKREAARPSRRRWFGRGRSGGSRSRSFGK